MASRMFSRASVSVRPWDMQPGIEGHSATSMPVSSGSSVTSSFILGFYYTNCTLLPAMEPQGIGGVMGTTLSRLRRSARTGTLDDYASSLRDLPDAVSFG